MSFFSPITNRSFPVRFLYLVVYGLLAGGALSMLVPLLISVTGSMSGPSDPDPVAFFPRFLVKDEALWARFVEARYGGALDNLKMAWSDEGVDFYEIALPDVSAEKNAALWKEFRAGQPGALPAWQAGLAFTRPNRREVALENEGFRHWLLTKYGGLDGVEEALLIDVERPSQILPPIQSALVLPILSTPFFQAFESYLSEVPEDHRLIWDVGGFYRAVYLPQNFGGSIVNYNEEFGTNYRSFAEVPFPATQPAIGGGPWFRFVSRVLNADFVEFSPEGHADWKSHKLSKLDFLRTVAKPGQVRVTSLDRDFAAWAESRGVPDARIPARWLDWEAFQSTRAFWRWQFVSQNFRYVIQEVVVQGNGARNTLILVVLSILSALTVNPMAAYALSRFRLPQSYQVLLFFLATIAFPAEVAMIPNFLQIKELGMINTFWALVVPGMVNGFSIFLLKGFFDSLPRELYEAADIDGANEWQIFWGITMNLSRPILAVLALGAFTAAYGAFMFALILAPDPGMWTLMVWIYQLQQGAGQGIVYASVLLTAIPTLVVYLCTQNIIMRGIIVPSDK